MRSRYTAFTRADVDYLESTLTDEAKVDFDRAETESWAKEARWQGLDIRSAPPLSEDGNEGQVEFVARYRLRGTSFAHHELASFRKVLDRWMYTDGVINPKPPQRTVVHVGRNDPCPCGSGKKYKKCCGA